MLATDRRPSRPRHDVKKNTGWLTAIVATAGVLALLSTTALSAPVHKSTPKAQTKAPAAEAPAKPVARTASSSALPRVLTAADAERYREIFDFQERGKFAEADRLIASLTNRVLMGHVLAQRYLHPSFRPKYADLASWMAQYADHPDAGKIYALALKRRGHGALPKPPTYSAGNLPDNVEIQMLASAARAAQAPWGSGLERFRAGRYGEAAQQFERVAMTPNLSPWIASAGAFWAARSYLRAGQPEQVNHWMTVAAQQPRTFYGLLALHQLGVEPPLNWKTPSAGDAGFKQVLGEAPGKRALALIESQDTGRAERELLGLRPNASTDQLLALATVAQEAHLPALSMKIGRQLLDKGIALDAALFPIPGWQPEGGFKVDRALVYALMRQESGFNPQALSPVGARGLMQLMPATAGFIAKDKSLAAKAKAELFDPTLNITLGQRYVAHLLADRGISNDVIVMTAAYNGGPGNVAKWQRNVDYKDDPLLYIATIPARETRQFIERVFANLWIYRTRLGQPAPELIALAEGKWPLYAALDSSSTSVAERFVGEDGTLSSGDYGRLPNGGN